MNKRKTSLVAFVITLASLIIILITIIVIKRPKHKKQTNTDKNSSTAKTKHSNTPKTIPSTAKLPSESNPMGKGAPLKSTPITEKPLSKVKQSTKKTPRKETSTTKEPPTTKALSHEIPQKYPLLYESVKDLENAGILLNVWDIVAEEIEELDAHFTLENEYDIIDLKKLLKFNIELINFFIDDKEETVFNRTLDSYLEEPIDASSWETNQINEEILFPLNNLQDTVPERIVLNITGAILRTHYNETMTIKIGRIYRWFVEFLEYQKKSQAKTKGCVIDGRNILRAMKLMRTLSGFGLRDKIGDLYQFLKTEIYVNKPVPGELTECFLFCLNDKGYEIFEYNGG